MKINKSLFLVVCVLFLCAGIYSERRYFTHLQKAKQERRLGEARRTAWRGLQESIKSQISQFNGQVGILVKDLETGWELSYEKNRLFPSASLAKVPLMAAAFLAAEQGRIKLGNNLKLKPADKLAGSGILKNMPVDSTFSLERLIGLMIYESDNTATNMITNLVGVDYLNHTFKAFGLKNTELSRKIADYRLRNKGIENYTTAEDMALLLEKIYRRTLGNKVVSDRCINTLKLTRLNDRLPKYLPAELTVAHKTGLERDVCHDAGIVFSRNGDFIIVVLTGNVNSSGLSSKEFIARIAWLVNNYFEQLR